MAKGLEAIGRLTDELDGLFAKMGRLTVAVRVGQRCPLHLAATTPRSVEVKVPKAQEDGREIAMLLECACDGNFHTPDPAHHRQNSLPEFDVYVSDTPRQAAGDGPFRAQSVKRSAHKLQFATDYGSVFVTLYAKRECHVELLCRANVGQPGGNFSAAEAASSSADSEDDDARRRTPGVVSRGLQAKLQLRRQDRTSHAPTR